MYDQQGNYLGIAPGESGGDPTLDSTLGAKVWRWLHPGQERAEYEGMGIEPPPQTTINDVAQQAASDVRNIVTPFADYGKWVIVGLVAYAIIQVVDRIPSQGRVKQYAKQYSRRARRAIARRIEA